MDTFDRDLKKGKKIEEKHLAIIQKTYPDAYIVEGYFKEWDIWIPSIGIGIEVKSDIMSQQTGNIVVEIKFNGEPSALSTTKAKYWIFDTGVDTIYVDVDDLKELVDKSKDRLRTFTAKGDMHPKDAYLIKQKYIETIKTTMQPETKGQLDKFL